MIEFIEKLHQDYDGLSVSKVNGRISAYCNLMKGWTGVTFDEDVDIDTAVAAFELGCHFLELDDRNQAWDMFNSHGRCYAMGAIFNDDRDDHVDADIAAGKLKPISGIELRKRLRKI